MSNKESEKENIPPTQHIVPPPQLIDSRTRARFKVSNEPLRYQIVPHDIFMHWNPEYLRGAILGLGFPEPEYVTEPLYNVTYANPYEGFDYMQGVTLSEAAKIALWYYHDTRQTPEVLLSASDVIIELIDY